jgi:hypothetical protein
MADAGNQTLSNQQIINAIFTLICNNGMFFDDYKSWNRKDTANQTWIYFKAHFLDAHHLLHQQQQTSAASGYHANAAIQHHQDSPSNDAAKALANLATATTSDCQSFTTLIANNTQLANQPSSALNRIQILER